MYATFHQTGIDTMHLGEKSDQAIYISIHILQWLGYTASPIYIHHPGSYTTSNTAYSKYKEAM